MTNNFRMTVKLCAVKIKTLFILVLVALLHLQLALFAMRMSLLNFVTCCIYLSLFSIMHVSTKRESNIPIQCVIFRSRNHGVGCSGAYIFLFSSMVLRLIYVINYPAKERESYNRYGTKFSSDMIDCGNNNNRGARGWRCCCCSLRIET